jgi:gas vesicle protein
MVDKVHADSSLKGRIAENLNHFVIKDKKVVEGLKRYQRLGKKFFILTNSDYHYTKLLLDYAINPYLNEGEQWTDLFEYVITLATKPRFFVDNLKFLQVKPDDGTMTNLQGKIKPGIYQSGGATQFTEDLNLNGDEILYVGDHIYGDILRLKKDCNWRTALVVEELGEEIDSQIDAQPVEQQIETLMEEKKDLEYQNVTLITDSIEQSTKAHDKTINQLQKAIAELDEKIAHLIKKQQSYFNNKWDRVFRAGAEESYFAYQVNRFACIYMEKLTDLLEQSPYTYFRASRRLLAHDIEVAS